MSGKDLNGILNEITAAIQWQQVAGLPIYNGTFSTAIGGYPSGAVLRATSTTGLWLSTADNNLTNPETGGAGWKIIANPFNFGVDTGAVNAYIVTLSPAQTLVTGMHIAFTTANSNTTTNPTLTINGATINITMPGGGALSAGQMPANAVISLAYNAAGPRLELQGIPIPASSKTGMIASWLGSSVPAGVLQWGVSTINVSRATYANLFASIGTTYGAGDGSTTFGLPAMPNNYALINVGSGTLGTLSIGSIAAHTHSYTYPNTPSGTGGSGNPNCVIPGPSAYGVTSSVGGNFNAAAGLSVNFGFYF